MKFTFKNLLSVSAVAFCAVAWTRCAADAQEPKPEAKQEDSSKPSATNTPVAEDQTAPAQAITDAAGSTNAAPAGTNEFAIIKAIPPSMPDNLKLTNAAKE